MIDENDAWNSFLQSGSVLDYLIYKELQNALADDGTKEDQDEVQNQGADRQTTEYR